MMKNGIITVEIYRENGNKMAFISEDGSSGCKYNLSDHDDPNHALAVHFEDYLNNQR